MECVFLFLAACHLFLSKEQSIELMSEKVQLIAGIDEAGRGCLAGPVVAAAVILPERHSIIGLADSKKCSEKKREKLAAEIKAKAIAWSIALVQAPQIDEINILQASFHAMAKAAEKLKTKPQALYIDGPYPIPQAVLIQCAPTLAKNSLPIQKAIVDGDAIDASISAASILAKTFRDAIMQRLGKKYPEYNFTKHKGYGTKEHREKIKEFGPCPLHRRSFKGVLL